MAQPLLPRVGVLALVPDYWGPYWEPRHHMMSRLAAYFNVVWLEPWHGWRDTRLAMLKRKQPKPKPPPGLHISRQEPWLPRFNRVPWLDNLTRRARLRRALAHLTSLGSRAIVLYIWRPEFLFA